MGNDMDTLGARLRLNDGVDEASLVAIARTTLLAGDTHNHVHRDMLTQARTLEELFSAFSHVVVRDGNGALVSCFHDGGRYNAPQDLFAAIASGVADGSWVAYTADYTGTALVTFDSGTASHEELGHVSTDPADYTGPWAYTAAAAMSLTGDPTEDLATILSHYHGAALEPVMVPPDLDYTRMVELAETAQPYIIENA